MNVEAGPTGHLQARFDDGMRFLVTALALKADHQNTSAAISAACDAVKCFMAIFEAAAERHLPDPNGDLNRFRDQCVALLNLRQDAEDVLDHALQAARLARDEAARVLPKLMTTYREDL